LRHERAFFDGSRTDGHGVGLAASSRMTAHKNETPDIPETADGVPGANHLVAEGRALSAVVAGGAIGAIAGPVGALAGAAIGGAIGAAIAITMERTDHGSFQHDRDLDDAIGVTSGSIGEPAHKKRPSKPAAEPTD